MNQGREKGVWAVIFTFSGISPHKPGKSGKMVLDNSHPRNRQPAEVGLMIDEINYFPERDNYQKKKKAADDWKELKKQKIFQDSKKRNKPDASRKSKPPQKEK
jgi:hypothetical protein